VDSSGRMNLHLASQSNPFGRVVAFRSAWRVPMRELLDGRKVNGLLCGLVMKFLHD
jgi:hypothetical protein